MTCCPCCHQPLPQIREGVRLSPLKAHIFDVIARASHDGVMLEHVNAICFDGRSNPRNIRMHIYQINDALAGTDVYITGGGAGMKGFFRLVRRRHMKVA